MTLELLIAAALLVSLILYALLGGADFGGGIWDLLAAGPRARRQRDAIAHAIGPIWEANHVWLILVIVLLFTGFPRAFGVIMTALHIPMSAMLVGIVLRGSTFVFRNYDTRHDAARQRWSALFGISSCFTPFVQGMVLGALATGRIRVDQNGLATGFLAGWTSSFALACGLFALVLFAFLAAAYMTVETRNQPDLQSDFRRRALWSGAVLGPVAALVFFTSKGGAPSMYHGLTQWWAPVLLGWTSFFAIAAFVTLWLRRFALARVAAIGQVTMILLGWCIAQYPNLVTPDLTVANSAAPETTLRLLVLALGLGTILLFPSLLFLFHIFKSEAAGGHPDS